VVIVEVELRRGRAVFPHRAEDLRDAGAAPLGEVQLLQELADTPVPVPARVGAAHAKLLQAHRPPPRSVTVRRAPGSDRRCPSASRRAAHPVEL